MPIRAELRPLYRTAEWRELRRHVLERAGNKCESCGRPNGAPVFTYTWQTWRRPQLPLGRQKLYHMVWVGIGGGRWRNNDGHRMITGWWPPSPGLPRRIWSVVTVAHVDPGGEHLDPDNVRAWCTWCHLHHDATQHKITRSARKDAGRPLLREAANYVP